MDGIKISERIYTDPRCSSYFKRGDVEFFFQIVRHYAQGVVNCFCAQGVQNIYICVSVYNVKRLTVGGKYIVMCALRYVFYLCAIYIY
jgi:hypothetical protein